MRKPFSIGGAIQKGSSAGILTRAPCKLNGNDTRRKIPDREKITQETTVSFYSNNMTIEIRSIYGVTKKSQDFSQIVTPLLKKIR